MSDKILVDREFIQKLRKLFALQEEQLKNQFEQDIWHASTRLIIDTLNENCKEPEFCECGWFYWQDGCRKLLKDCADCADKEADKELAKKEKISLEECVKKHISVFKMVVIGEQLFHQIASQCKKCGHSWEEHKTQEIEAEAERLCNLAGQKAFERLCNLAGQKAFELGISFRNNNREYTEKNQQVWQAVAKDVLERQKATPQSQL